MKPYYQDEAVTVYHGDCREIMPCIGRFNLLLTDPPYGIGGASGTVGKSRSGKHKYASFTDTFESVLNDVIPAIYLGLSLCERGIITPGPKMFQHYPKASSFGAIYQPATVSLSIWGRAEAQPILFYGRPPRIGIKIMHTVFTATKADAEGAPDHPCPKPLGVWKKIMDLGSIEGETILDPFAGSGTTGRAAKDLGRKCVLIEREEAYCEIIARRMAQEVFQL